VRHTLDRIFKLGAETVDMLIVNAGHPLVPDFIRADCAFSALAWHAFFEPFAHPQRKFVLKRERLIPIIETNADALYKYGVYVKQLPDASIHAKLKKMHVDTAKQYFDYCAHVTIARMEGEDLSWITQW